MFSRVGVPEEVLSDQGSQFLSGVMKEVSRLLSMKQLVTTPYHPMCNGLVERFNGTMKQMLKRMCAERPKDRSLPYLGSIPTSITVCVQRSTTGESRFFSM